MLSHAKSVYTDYAIPYARRQKSLPSLFKASKSSGKAQIATESSEAR